MHVAKLAVVLFAIIGPINARAVTIRPLAESYPNVAATPAIGQHWSKQDVLTLVGVFVGVITVIVGLVGILVASPKTRKWLCRPITPLLRLMHITPGTPAALPIPLPQRQPFLVKKWKKKDPKAVRQQQQMDYDELLKTRRGRY